MSWFSRALGLDAKREQLGKARENLDQQLAYEQGGGGFQDAFNQTAGAFLNNAMPQFQNQLQLTRENGVRRGISTGDLGTSTEGDLASAFQRNLANALGGLASQGYENRRNRILDIISGKIGSTQDELDSQLNLYGGLAQGIMKGAGSFFGAQ